MKPPSEGDIRLLLVGRSRSIAALAATSIAGGLAEAALLVIVTRSAFAITDDQDRFGILAGVETTLLGAVLIALLLVAVRLALAVVSAWQTAKLTSSVVADVRRNLARAFMSASWTAQHGQRSGRLQELLTTFTGQGASLVTSLMLGIRAGGSLLALVVTAVAVDPLAALTVIVAVVVLGSVLRPLRAAVKRAGARSAASGMSFATSLSETSQLGMEMHVFNVQPRATERIDDLIVSNEAASRRLTFLRQLVPAVYTGIAYLALVGALGVVSTIDSANLTSVGAVMLIMLRSFGYGQAVQTSVASINSAMPFLGALDAELEYYSAAASVDHGQAIGRIGNLSLQDVSFEYAADTPVLHNVTATIADSEVVGIVGPSGSGKSTLVQLLLGLRPPTHGAILADDRDISLLSKTEWARRVTFVPQEAHLIAGSVADNIRFFRDDVTQEQIEHAARLANLHEDVAAMDGGYERLVGEQGSHLSGGQKQRLIIARALVERPDVLILDEPTSSLDVRSESLIRKTLDDLHVGATVVIIAHRLSTLDICDRIMVIQDGELKGYDTPTNLESTNDFYREALVLSGLR